MTDQRDQSIEILLRQRQHDADAESTDRCVDAETIAGWMEDGLPADTRGAVEKHAAGCPRCQALLAAMARTVPDIDARPWWRSLTAKWLVPIAALATALALWISVGGRTFPAVPRTSTSPSIEASQDVNRTEAAPSAPRAPEPAAIPESAEKRSAQLAQTADARERRGFADSDRLERDRLAAANEPAPAAAAPATVGGVVGGTIDAARPQHQTAGDSPPGSPAPATPSAVAALPAPSPPAMPPPANVTSSEQKPATAKTLAEMGIVARDGLSRGFAAGSVDIQSPDPNYRWRILAPAGVQRSIDGGMTWAVVDPFATTRVAAPVALTAGFSPSRDTCWIVGRAGLVLLSTDGTTWQRRALPEQADLNGVRASDAQHAIVTTADSRQFVTTDGGVTWGLVR